MAKEIKHPIFRQFDLDEVVEIMLTDGDGEEIATAPGHRSEQELKLLAQQNGVRGPVNLVARLSNGLTNGPVQISVPAPRVPAASLFRSSRLTSIDSDSEPIKARSLNGRGRGRDATLEALNKSDEIALDSVQRLDRLATESMSSERARVDQEREYWQAKLDEAREQAREEASQLEERHDRELERVRDSQETVIEEMREAQERAVEAVREAMEEKIKAITDTYEKTLREQRMLEESKLKHMSQGTEERVSLVREMSEQTTKVLESSSAQTISTLKSQLEASLNRVRELEASREREAASARDRYEDLRDRLSKDIDRLREEKSKAEQSRLEMMMQNQRASSDEIRKEVDRVTSRYETEMKEAKVRHESEVKEMRNRFEQESRDQRGIIDSLRSKADDLATQMRTESTKAEIALLHEKANREPLKVERMLPFLSVLPEDQRVGLVGRAIASDIGIEYDDGDAEDRKPSMMDTVGKTIMGLMAGGLQQPPQQQQMMPQQMPQPAVPVAPPRQAVPRPARPVAPVAAPAPRPAASSPPASSSGFGQTEDV
jgi:hypothetical protein